MSDVDVQKHLQDAMTGQYFQRCLKAIKFNLNQDGNPQLVLGWTHGEKQKIRLEVKGLAKMKNEKVNAAIEYTISFDTSSLGDEVEYSVQSEKLNQLILDITESEFVTYAPVPYNCGSVTYAVDREDEKEEEEENDKQA